MEKQKDDLREIEIQPMIADVAIDIPDSGAWSLSRSSNYYINIVPQLLRQGKPDAYTPSTVAVGPLHKPVRSSADSPLKIMEENKKQYIKALVERNKKNLQEIMLKIKDQEEEISRYYYPTHVVKKYGSDKFAQILLDDACFVVQHFVEIFQRECKDGATRSTPWAEFAIWYDMVLWENQIPYYLMEEIYQVIDLNNNDISFIELTCFYFHKCNLQSMYHEDVGHPRTFVDLLRTFLLPQSFRSGSVTMTDDQLESPPTASKLLGNGVKIEVSEKYKSFLEVDFQDGVLRMGKFSVDSTTERCLRNIVALEQCSYPGTASVTQYLVLLHFLAPTRKDVDILIAQKIIDNGGIGAAKIVEMLESITEFSMDVNANSKYLKLSNDLNAFIGRSKNIYVSMFKREHCSSPWKLGGFIFASMASLYTLFNGTRSLVVWISSFK